MGTTQTCYLLSGTAWCKTYQTYHTADTTRSKSKTIFDQSRFEETTNKVLSTPKLGSSLGYQMILFSLLDGAVSIANVGTILAVLIQEEGPWAVWKSQAPTTVPDALRDFFVLAGLAMLVLHIYDDRLRLFTWLDEKLAGGYGCTMAL